MKQLILLKVFWIGFLGAMTDSEMFFKVLCADKIVTVSGKMALFLERQSPLIAHMCENQCKENKKSHFYRAEYILQMPAISAQALKNLILMIEKLCLSNREEKTPLDIFNEHRLVAAFDGLIVADELQCLHLKNFFAKGISTTCVNRVWDNRPEDILSSLEKWLSDRGVLLKSSLGNRRHLEALIGSYMIRTSAEIPFDHECKKGKWKNFAAAAAALNYDGSLLFLGSKPITVWDTQTGVCSKKIKVSGDSVVKMSVDDQGNILATICVPRTFCCSTKDPSTLMGYGYLSVWGPGHKSPIFTPKEGCLSVAVAPKGHYVFAGLDDTFVALSMESKRIVKQEKLPGCYAIAAGETSLMGMSSYHSVNLYDMRTNVKNPLSKEQDFVVSSLALNDKNSLLASGNEGGQIYIWDLRFYRDPLKTISSNEEGKIRSVSIDEWGRILLIDNEREGLYLRSLQNDQVLCWYNRIAGDVYSACLSRNGLVYTRPLEKDKYTKRVSLNVTKNIAQMDAFLKDVKLEQAALLTAYSKKYTHSGYVSAPFDQYLTTEHLQKTFETLPDHIQNHIAKKFTS